MVVWSRLIRFIAQDGRVLRGEPIVTGPSYDAGLATDLKARVIEGDDIYSDSVRITDEVVSVKRLLGPLAPQEVPIVRCVGLNYMKHIKEAGRTPPPFPFIFFKPSTTIADHLEEIVIPKICQDDQADYEGELVVIIGKDAKDVSEVDALDYVAAYTAGDDISSRKLQRDPTLAGGVPQWGFSKGFDRFAPLGPALISSKLIKDPDNLRLQTLINGDVRQDENTSDLLFNVRYLIHYLSQGTTIQKGSIIMTGTPGGIGSSQKPPQWLKPGDIVDVHIEELGTLRHGIAYE
jgi:2-keto-4-pentenoate hydratase/2-oxohepta-3-ene-1,7-dioic acid hydratase in catechol pathway